MVIKQVRIIRYIAMMKNNGQTLTRDGIKSTKVTMTTTATMTKTKIKTTPLATKIAIMEIGFC